MKDSPEIKLFVKLCTDRITFRKKTLPYAYSMSNIAKRCKMSGPGLSMILRGKREPSLATAIRLANYFKIDLSQVQRGVEDDPIVNEHPSDLQEVQEVLTDVRNDFKNVQP